MSLEKPERLFWYSKKVEEGGKSSDPDFSGSIMLPAGDPKINLISSLTDHEGVHLPVIDIDSDVLELVPSSTAGHFHLYIDTLFTLDQLTRLLQILTEVGIVEQGYTDASIARGSSFVRPPHVKKPL